MTELKLKQMLLDDGFIQSEDDPSALFKPNGLSIRFYTTSEGISMFNAVDSTKPKYKWQYFRFRTNFIKSYEDILYLLQGSTARGY